MTKSLMFCLSLGVAGALVLSGCGLKYDLYLPEDRTNPQNMPQQSEQVSASQAQAQAQTQEHEQEQALYPKGGTSEQQ